MSEFILRTVGLTKVYRLYSKPHYRLLDMFGLLRRTTGAYTEHRALDGITLEVSPGEKVAIIGRNGAGKSTLLKLATRVIEPTSGRIEVAEGAHALLQIGTGFHPDFTGRENAYSYLAHLGVVGREAQRKVLDIIDFAELEEYIDQPIKTYSTGMVARLMFATSTAINPKLLVLDEILGVGDAYFAQKSYERIRELCEKSGTTVLLVSHDVYSAAKLCERMIWIDRGQIMIDGPSALVTKAYEDSIRTQEEARLRKAKLQRLSVTLPESEAARQTVLLLEIGSWENLPLPAPVYFRHIALSYGDLPPVELPLQISTDDERATHLDFRASSWGDLVEWQGCKARPMLNYGSPFKKVTGVFVVPDRDRPEQEAVRAAIECWCDQDCELAVRAFGGDRHIGVAKLRIVKGSWVTNVLEIGKRTAADSVHDHRSEISTKGVQGTGVIQISDVRILNAYGVESHYVQHGEPMTIVVDYHIAQPGFRSRPQVLIAFHRDGVLDVCRFIARDLQFNGQQCARGAVQLAIPAVNLGNGTYSVTVMIVKEGYFDSSQTLFYSINPSVYAAISRVTDFVVTGGDAVSSGTCLVAVGEWSMLQPILKPA